MPEAPEVIEVDPYEALREDNEGEVTSSRPRPFPQQQQPPQPIQTGGTDQEQESEAPQPEGHTVEEDMEILIPKKAAKEWKIGQGEYQRTYIQRELSVVGKTQWFSLVGKILDESLSGDNKLSLNSLLTPPQIVAGKPVIQQFADADTFVHAVGKLLRMSPEFLTDSICIWLDVPDYEWDLVAMLMKTSPEAGGVSDDDFEEIFATFIDQNLPSIDRFFRERYPRLRARWQARQKETRDPSRFQKR